MIKHVVMWRFKEGEEENMHKFLDGLKGLVGQIECIRSLEVGVNVNPAGNFDAVLISEFDSLEDLDKYQNDPRHLEVSGICKAIRLERSSVDFEV